MAYSLSDYGQALLQRGELDAAEPLLEELVELQAHLEHPAGLQLATARWLYGTCLSRQGRFAEAEALLVAAGELYAGRPDARPDVARDVRAALLEHYAAWSTAEPEAGIAARAERWQAPFPAED